LIENARREAEKQMEKLLHLDFMNGIDCETEILTGSTVDTICGQSARDDVDLLVTATHGHTGFRHAMLGSAAEQIIRYAEAPVLIVPNRTADN
jgi:nucleotide-binding universal stress UspA family protein